ncbi:hypothetical protein CDAR_277271 [Caerostris darwini]|uniref:Uncharacterized protein n=1 Tax=Caerostris darwini TaxID=1538125 RepID=A0AAV4VU81_9ARAC|nr:hypothetical protein CDAR_277271 [Caerostris darwini]
MLNGIFKRGKISCNQLAFEKKHFSLSPRGIDPTTQWIHCTGEIQVLLLKLPDFRIACLHAQKPSNEILDGGMLGCFIEKQHGLQHNYITDTPQKE